MRQNLVLQTMASGLSFPKARAPNLDLEGQSRKAHFGHKFKWHSPFGLESANQVKVWEWQLWGWVGIPLIKL